MRYYLLFLCLGLASLAARTYAQSTQTLFLPIMQRPPAPGSVQQGEATYYVEADGSGNCSFEATPHDLMVAAMNHTDYDTAALCGAYVEIKGPEGVVTVRIVDRCPGCPKGHIDLSPEAFERLAPLIRGRVPITWRIVSPALSGPIRYRFKEGSSQWWTAVQVRHHRNPITKVEYRDAAGSFVALPRTDYNYFVAAHGMGPGPYTLRVTDLYGNVLIDSQIPLQLGVDINGGGQFPPAP